MSKEELKKEAEEKANAFCKENKLIAGSKILIFGSAFERGYLASAEPREKQIAELEKKLEQIKNEKFETALSQIKHDRQKVIEYNKRLQKENAELKADNDARKFAMAMSEKVEKQLREEIAELKALIDNDVDKKIYVQLAKKAELADVQKGQLTTAKELIEDMYDVIPSSHSDYYKDVMERAKQFISEVEK